MRLVGSERKAGGCQRAQVLLQLRLAARRARQRAVKHALSRVRRQAHMCYVPTACRVYCCASCPAHGDDAVGGSEPHDKRKVRDACMESNGSFSANRFGVTALSAGAYYKYFLARLVGVVGLAIRRSTGAQVRIPIYGFTASPSLIRSRVLKTSLFDCFPIGVILRGACLCSRCTL